MDLEFKDNSRRGRYIIVMGILLALAAGGGAFFLITQAQQQAASQPTEKVMMVVAVKTIEARQPIEEGDIALKEVPAFLAGSGTFNDVTKVVKRVPAVTILENQPITANLLASSVQGDQFSILKPEETIAPDSPYWRAVAITVAPDLAVGGLVKAGMTVDVFVTATVEASQALIDSGRYITDKTTKVAYQDIEILDREADYYIIRLPLAEAEEIAHLQATGAVSFTFALRPPEDTRIADAKGMGETTNLIINRYGLPVPQPLSPGSGLTSTTPRPTATPTPSHIVAVQNSPAPTPAP
jgi:Flp pilus assembly protein CpaB